MHRGGALARALTGLAMQDYEKLGAFYLGRALDDAGEVEAAPLLYDSADLTTHAVIIGMTGSGKTGLGIGLIEEAAMDRVPVIAIDPKGDLGNLLLTFPELAPVDFRPWVNEQAARQRGEDIDTFAAGQAALWRKGLAEWGQDAARIARLRETVDLRIYTPGSSAGLPLAVLKGFAAPPREQRADKDAYREKISATATSVLALAGIDADPVTSREHVLLGNLLEHHWDRGESLDLPALLGAIQQPPMQQIGVLDIDTVYPPKDRAALAMRLNNLVAAPGFQAWLEGEPMDAQTLLYAPGGRPRVSVISIAHLNDRERMFFVTALLGELLTWMRAQPGTPALRAVLYMDEIFGYMPPSANPPSKVLLLTLLKQARAFGVGLVLSTQNPVDLDYKGLSNAGTWFIGRLQTERDKERVLDGLRGAAGGGFDGARLRSILSGLGSRRFLLHNVHEDSPVVFATRWVMSYLAGPLTREQIGRLMAGVRAVLPAPAGTAPAAAGTAAVPPAAAAPEPVVQAARAAPPAVPAGVAQYSAPVPAGEGTLVWTPRVLGVADLVYANARYQVHAERRVTVSAPLDDGPVALDWDLAEPLPVDFEGLTRGAPPQGECQPLPMPARKTTAWRKWTTQYRRWLRNDRALELLRSPELKAVAAPGQDEDAFRAQLQVLSHERRDAAVAKLRKRYDARLATLERRADSARQRLEKEREQASASRTDALVSIGSSLLGAFIGRKRSVRSAVRSAGRARGQAGDVRRAEQKLESVRQQVAELEQAFQDEVEQLEDAYDPQLEPLETLVVRPKSTDILVHAVALVWLPRRVG